MPKTHDTSHDSLGAAWASLDVFISLWCTCLSGRATVICARQLFGDNTVLAHDESHTVNLTRLTGSSVGRVVLSLCGRLSRHARATCTHGTGATIRVWPSLGILCPTESTARTTDTRRHATGHRTRTSDPRIFLRSHHPPVLVEASPSFSWFRRRMMSLLENCLRLRVRRPLVYQPHGEEDGRPPELLPSPPPIG